jgi:serine/threonine-protein kinase RsbW
MPTELASAFRLSLPCDSRAPAVVRRELDKLETIDSVRGNANLVATEMVSNAVRHSGGTPDHQIEIQARLSSKLLEISVHDPGLSEYRPQIRTGRGESDIGGLGLLLVERLSDRWGTARPDGHVVWAQFLI